MSDDNVPIPQYMADALANIQRKKRNPGGGRPPITKITVVSDKLPPSVVAAAAGAKPARQRASTPPNNATALAASALSLASASAASAAAATAPSRAGGNKAAAAATSRSNRKRKAAPAPYDSAANKRAEVAFDGGGGAPPLGSVAFTRGGSFNDDGWVFPKNWTQKSYYTNLLRFMSYLHGRKDVYPVGTEFTREQLLEVKPVHVRDWLAIKAFGKTDYTEADRSTGARVATLEYEKKSLSFFMPNQIPQWCEGRGNPTKSKAVNDVIRHVLQREARRMGAKSRVKRALTENEFLLEMKLMRQEGDWTHMCKYPVMSMWQFNLISRIDDTCHHQVRDLKGHERFPFALQTKVRWSKNVVDERKCPDQILLGANDPTWCLLLRLSIYLESFLAMFPAAKYLFTEHPEDKAPENLKNTWRSRLQKVVWTRPEFADIEDDSDDDEDGVGTHSRRKFAADYAANNGHGEDDIEIRGRWKQKRGGKIVFRYIGLKKAFEDANVCGTLCIGGPVLYELKDGLNSTITQQWLFQHVVPNIRRRFSSDHKLCNVLALALLYACLSEEDENIFVPGEIRERVRASYNALGLEETQPVRKTPLHIYRIRDQLCIDPIEQSDLIAAGGHSADNAVARGYAPVGVNGVTADAIQTLLVRQTRMQNEVNQRFAGTDAAIGELRNFCGKNFKTLNNNIRCFGGTVQGAFVRQRTQQDDNRLRMHTVNQGFEVSGELEEVIKPAQLSHNPRSLLLLWKEYKVGLDGMKPAEQFTRSEKNVNKSMAQKYSRRNNVWQCIQRLVNAGFTLEVAIQKIHRVYGFGSSPTKIINEMIADKKKYKDRGGFHPDLQ